MSHGRHYIFIKNGSQPAAALPKLHNHRNEGKCGFVDKFSKNMLSIRYYAIPPVLREFGWFVCVIMISSLGGTKKKLHICFIKKALYISPSTYLPVGKVCRFVMFFLFHKSLVFILTCKYFTTKDEEKIEHFINIFAGIINLFYNVSIFYKSHAFILAF